MQLYDKYRTMFSLYGVDTPLRKSHFMAQIDHESNLKPQRESLYYTDANRAKNIFKTPFKGKSLEFVSKYLRDSEKMANYVYANRMGNGDEFSGDGYKYRGGGFLQHTGKYEYERLTKESGVDYVNNPELLETEADAVISALSYWKRNNLNKYADIDDLDGVSDLVNIGRKTVKVGDANGYKDRQQKLRKWKKLLNVSY